MKFQEPNLQVPNKLQNPISKTHVWNFGSWNLIFIWSLVLVSWNFFKPHATSPDRLAITYGDGAVVDRRSTEQASSPHIPGNLIHQ